MSIPTLSKEDVVYKKEEDPIHMGIGLSESVDAEDKKTEDSHGTTKDSEESIDDIREKIVEFMKSQGYSYAEGEREFDDETNDLFAKGSTLVELSITVGIDKEVIAQMMEQAN